jgi:hypothetical protein
VLIFVLSVVFAVVAAGSNALGTVLQRRAVLDVPASRALRPSLLRDLMRTPVWYVGILGVIGAAVFQALALAIGSLAVVQPLFVLELPLALVIGGIVFHVHRSRRAWAGVACIVVGLGVSLGSLAPGGGHAQVPGLLWVPVLAVTVGVGAALTITGVRRPLGPARAACLGAAAAIGNALAAALIKSSVDILAHHGIVAFLLSWQTYSFAAAGVIALFLLETAMQGGPLIASQPALTLGDAVVSFCLGVTLYGEQPRAGLWLVPALAGFALLLYGTFTLSHTQCLADCLNRGEEQEVIKSSQGQGPTPVGAHPVG